MAGPPKAVAPSFRKDKKRFVKEGFFTIAAISCREEIVSLISTNP
jgi:hypothetical protein